MLLGGVVKRACRGEQPNGPAPERVSGARNRQRAGWQWLSVLLLSLRVCVLRTRVAVRRPVTWAQRFAPFVHRPGLQHATAGASENARAVQRHRMGPTDLVPAAGLGACVQVHAHEARAAAFWRLLEGSPVLGIIVIVRSVISFCSGARQAPHARHSCLSGAAPPTTQREHSTQQRPAAPPGPGNAMPAWQRHNPPPAPRRALAAPPSGAAPGLSLPRHHVGQHHAVVAHVVHGHGRPALLGQLQRQRRPRHGRCTRTRKGRRAQNARALEPTPPTLA